MSNEESSDGRAEVRRLIDQARELSNDEQYLGAQELADAAEELLREFDPIETGREVALAQWEQRWAALRTALVMAPGYLKAMNRIEAAIPTGLPIRPAAGGS